MRLRRMVGFRWTSQFEDLNRLRLTAEARDECFHNRGNQEDEHKVSRSAAGGMIVVRFGHGSSQGLIFGESFFPQIHGAGLLHLSQV